MIPLAVLLALCAPTAKTISNRSKSSHAALPKGHGYPSTQIFVNPGLGLGWDWGWNDPWYWGPYGTNEVEIRHVNYGTLQFKVEPGNTKVYVDKKYIGEVDKLDHHKAYVAAGDHEVMLKAPNGQTIERNFYVAAGKNIKIEEKL